MSARIAALLLFLNRGQKEGRICPHITPCDYDSHTHESEAHQLSKLVLSQWLINRGASSRTARNIDCQLLIGLQIFTLNGMSKNMCLKFKKV